MKKILCCIIALLLILPVFSISATAGGASYASVNGTSRGISYYYRDSYFEANASEYNASLSTMSFILAKSGSAVSSDNWTHQYSTLYNLLGQLGFTDMAVNDDFTQYPGTDTMGVGMAHKTINVGGTTYTLLAIVPRSDNYEYEWANNFTLGTSGDAEGFSGSAAKVEAFAASYVATYGANFVGELKLWIVGYSRGAAVANLTAGHITKAGKIGNVNVAKENIYAYTFETPAGAHTSVVSVSEAKSYTNIHNIISSNDMVTKVAPANWGFIRYGTDETVIPETRTAENSALFDFAVSCVSDWYAGYDSNGKRIFATETFQAKKLTSDVSRWAQLGSWVNEDGVYHWEFVDSDTAWNLLVEDCDKTMSEVLDDTISAFCAGIGSRTAYAYGLEDLVRLLIPEYFTSFYQTNALNIALATLEAELAANKESIVIAAVTANYSVLENILTSICNNITEASGIDLAAYDVQPAQVAVCIAILARTIIADAVIDGGTDLLSLIENIDILSLPHEGEQVSAWLRALDPNYNPAVSAKNAAVKDVIVTVTKTTETKKVLFVKVKVTTYTVNIIPVSDEPVQKVEYRTLLIGKMKDGTTFTRDTNLTYMYVSVTDADGNVTNWQYSNGKVTKVN